MSRNIPKTGLAGRMRAWMSGSGRPFSRMDLYVALGIAPGAERERVARALHDFLKRREVVPAPDGRVKRMRYRYNAAWRRGTKAGLRAKILKAMYFSGTFAVTDIRRLAGTEKRNYADKIARRLLREGFLRVVGRRPCAHGAGAERLYHIVNRDRFRLEVMG